MKRIPLDSINNLDDLYKEWKRQHKEDKHWKETFPQDIDRMRMPQEDFKSSWNEDGRIGNEDKTIEVLFILAESNLKNCDGPGKDNSFWLKEKLTSGSRMSIPRRIRLLTARIKGMNETQFDDSWFEDIACVNLNKRGGYPRCNSNQLINYVQVYKEYINKQIELLSPKKICVIVSSKVNQQIIEALNMNGDIYLAYHPASRVSDEKYLASLKKL